MSRGKKADVGAGHLLEPAPLDQAVDRLRSFPEVVGGLADIQVGCCNSYLVGTTVVGFAHVLREVNLGGIEPDFEAKLLGYGFGDLDGQAILDELSGQFGADTRIVGQLLDPLFQPSPGRACEEFLVPSNLFIPLVVVCPPPSGMFSFKEAADVIRLERWPFDSARSSLSFLLVMEGC